VLPAGLNLLNVRGASIEEWTTVDQDGAKMLRVKFRTPLKETTYRLMVEGELSDLPKTGQMTLPEFVLRGVKQERGYVAVASVGNIEIAPGEATNATRIDVKELPAELKAATDRPVLLGFRYYQHPFTIAVALSRHEDSPVLSAIVEMGDLATIMAKQGSLITRAVYLVKNNKKQFLTVTLPAGAQLWSAIVDGKSEKPAVGDRGTLLIPLVQSEHGERAFVVELVYFQTRPQLSTLGTFHLDSLTLDIPVSATNWTLYLPKAYRFFRFRGNIDTGNLAYAFVDEPRMMVAYASGGGYVHRQSGVEDGRADLIGEPDSKAYDEYRALAASPRSDGPVKEGKTMERRMEVAMAQLETSGILPLKIRLPRGGRAYQVSRLMTASEPLTVRAIFVGVPQVVWPVGLLGLTLLAGGAVTFTVRQRRTA